MKPEPPAISLIVIRSADIHRAVSFYERLGLTFSLHSHGEGPKHYACESNGCVFEIYPRKNSSQSTSSTRLGFRVSQLEVVITELRLIHALIVSEPSHSEWGYRAIVKDFDGHTVELVQE